MQVKPDSQYALKDLYEEIGFLDRRISYCQTLEKFDTDQARATALHKLVTKREPLVKAAMGMAGRGVECDPKYLPRSLRAPVEVVEAEKATP
jgi:hypothetical protein